MSKNRDLGNYGSAALLDASSNAAANTVVQRTANGDINANNVTASTFTGTLSGSATSLATARTIALGGDVSGSASFDGSANVTITATIADDSHNHIVSNVDGLQDALDAKAPLASPTLTGTPAAPTANAGTNTTQIATTAFVQTAVSGLVDSAPETLDTLNELAAALGDDPNFATTVSTQIGGKAPLTGEGTSGTWGISITGNAATVTNGVYTTGNQTIGGVKTFSNNAVFDGNVGIGRSSPEAKLDVLDTKGSLSSTKDLTGRFYRFDGTYNPRLEIRHSTSGTDIHHTYSSSASNLTFSVGNLERVRIDGNGFVGIGTSSPSAKLDVSLGTDGTAFAINGASGDNLVVGSDSGGLYQEWNSNTPARSIIRLQTRNSGAGAYTAIYVDGGNQNFRVQTNNTERLRITDTGNVGIGTSSPSSKLQVNGVAKLGSASGSNPVTIGTHIDTFSDNFPIISTNNHADLAIGVNVSIKSDHALNTINNHSSIRGSGIVFGGNGYDLGTNSIAFFTNPSATATAGTSIAPSAAKMVIENTGNVGIGTTSPGSYKLYVAGDQYISGTLTEASSQALKENIAPISNALDLVSRLTGVTYDRIDGSDYNRAGLIAEQVQDIIPNVVQKDESGNPMGIKYTNIIAYLVESIKELKEEIDVLKGK